ncbi:MAG: phage major capsid protein [Gemmatimonadaceae bacterium]
MSDTTLNAREEREYRLGDALAQLADDPERKRAKSGLAFEVSDELAKTRTPQHGGLLVPYSMSMRAGLDTATSTKGQELKFTQARTFIDALRKRAIVIRAGATVLEGLTGDLAIPRGNGVATASWSTQNPGADVSDTNLLLNSVAMAPKELIGTTSFSRQLLAQSQVSTSVDELVRNDLVRVHASTIDLAALNGSGASGQPTGLLNQANTNPIALGTNGQIATWPQTTSFEKTVAVADGDVDLDTMAYVTTPEIRDRWRITDRQTTSGWFILDGDQSINDYPVLVSNQLPKNLVKGTSGAVCHPIIFGAMSEVIIGFWGAFEIVADPFRLKKQGMIEFTSYQLIDVAVRHPQAFAISKDALA